MSIERSGVQKTVHDSFVFVYSSDEWFMIKIRSWVSLWCHLHKSPHHHNNNICHTSSVTVIAVRLYCAKPANWIFSYYQSYSITSGQIINTRGSHIGRHQYTGPCNIAPCQQSLPQWQQNKKHYTITWINVASGSIFGLSRWLHTLPYPIRDSKSESHVWYYLLSCCTRSLKKPRMM